MKHLLIALCLAISAPAWSQEPQAPSDDRVAVRVSTPADAVTWAIQDLAALPEDARLHVRYIWDPTGNVENGQVLSLVLNMAVSQADSSVRPDLVPGSQGQLWRFDLRRCCPEEQDFVRVRDILEELDLQEPYFHMVQEQVTFKTVRKKVKVTVEPYEAVDNRIYDYVYEERDVEEVDQRVQAAVFPLHVGPGMETLSATMGTNNPIMRLDWFMVKCLTTLDGGVYYDLLDIRDSADVNGKRVTAQQQWLTALGADEQLISRLNASNRAVVFRSNVAQRRPRLIEVYFGSGVAPAEGIPLISLTHDVFPEDIDPREHIVRNLLNFYDAERKIFKDRAREAIGVRRNGWPIYALFDQAGDLQEVVPDKVARDDVPHPFDARLQPGLSCIRCHFPDDNWKPVKNDLGHMLRTTQNGLRMDIFDDLASDELPYEAINRMAGQFGATDFQLDNAFRISRNAISLEVYRATKFSGLRVDGATLPQLGERVMKVHSQYMFDPITPQSALREAGFKVSEELAVQLFNQVCPPLPPNSYGFSPEDPLIGRLRAWTPEHPLNMSRFEWEQIYPDVMIRIATAATQQDQGGN